MAVGRSTVADLVTEQTDRRSRSARPIPVAGPSITEAEIAAVARAAGSAWYADAYRPIAEFESAFAAYIGRRHAVALPSCTSALHLILAALGVGPGDEVVVADATWIATSAPISYVGATPTFADVDPITWCLSADSLVAAITPRTRAVIAVDLYGSTPDYDALAEVCNHAGVHLIEDAAEAIGSKRQGRHAGSFGIASCFSFHGSKTLTTGEGGMLVFDDTDLFERVSVLRDHGRRPGDVSFQNEEVAFKYKMSALQAAMGTAQLERVDELVDGKRRIFGWYQERLGDDSRLVWNAEPQGTFNSVWMTTAIVDAALGLTKEALAESLAAEDIHTRPFFSPLSSLPAYRDLPTAIDASEKNLVARNLGTYGINLPSALRLSEEEVDVVCRAVSAALDGADRHRVST